MGRDVRAASSARRLLPRAAGAGHHRRQRRDADAAQPRARRRSPASSACRSWPPTTSTTSRAEDAKTQDMLLCIGTGSTIDDAEPHEVLLRRVLHEVRRGDGRRRFGEYPRGAREHAARSPSAATSSSSSARSSCRCSRCPKASTEDELPARAVHGGPQGALRRPDARTRRWSASSTSSRSSSTRASRRTSSSCRTSCTGPRTTASASGPGRGSAAGSIIAYALGITNLDPLEHGLLFERFLNPERTEMPDIDIDFDDERRGEVIEYVREKYGEDKVAQIITFGTMKARARGARRRPRARLPVRRARQDREA